MSAGFTANVAWNFHTVVTHNFHNVVVDEGGVVVPWAIDAGEDKVD